MRPTSEVRGTRRLAMPSVLLGNAPVSPSSSSFRSDRTTSRRDLNIPPSRDIYRLGGLGGRVSCVRTRIPLG